MAERFIVVSFSRPPKEQPFCDIVHISLSVVTLNVSILYTNPPITLGAAWAL